MYHTNRLLLPNLPMRNPSKKKRTTEKSRLNIEAKYKKVIDGWEHWPSALVFYWCLLMATYLSKYISIFLSRSHPVRCLTVVLLRALLPWALHLIVCGITSVVWFLCVSPNQPRYLYRWLKLLNIRDGVEKRVNGLDNLIRSLGWNWFEK